MRPAFEAFWAALRFFTRLPVPASVGHTQAGLDRAARFFPLIGWIVGGIGAAVTEITALGLPVSLAILLGMVATLLVTGAFHEDGLADSCDGFGGGWNRAQILTIMKDSRIGSYGAIGIGMALLIKFNALLEIDATAPPPALALALLAGHAISRLAPVGVMRCLDYAREEGASKSKPLVQSVDDATLGWAFLFGLLPCLLLPLQAALYGMAAALLVAVLAIRYCRHRLDGYTGDSLGATQQLAEIAFYLGLLCAST